MTIPIHYRMDILVHLPMSHDSLSFPVRLFAGAWNYLAGPLVKTVLCYVLKMGSAKMAAATKRQTRLIADKVTDL